jgi:hypothetical protein
MVLGLTQGLTEMSTRSISWGVKAVAARADNLTTFMNRLSGSLGTSNSWNPQGLSRPVMGLLLYPKVPQNIKRFKSAEFEYVVLVFRRNIDLLK